MPRKTKYDLASIHAAMAIECPECHYRIAPPEIIRIDSERQECPKCKAKFAPAEKSGPKMRTS